METTHFLLAFLGRGKINIKYATLFAPESVINDASPVKISVLKCKM